MPDPRGDPSGGLGWLAIPAGPGQCTVPSGWPGINDPRLPHRRGLP